MSFTNNGFRPGETKARTLTPKKRDGGHSIVQVSTTLSASGWRWTYAVTCECGKRYTGRTSDTPYNTHSRHVRKATA